MAELRSEHTHARPRNRPNWTIWTLIAVLLAVVLAGTLWVPLYNRTTPALGSFPFFYWYQLLWVPVVALVSWLAYQLSKRARRDTAAPPAATSASGLSAPRGPAPPLRGPAEASPGGPARPQEPPPLPKRPIPPRTEES
jgi:hypothetical protein